MFAHSEKITLLEKSNSHKLLYVEGYMYMGQGIQEWTK